MRQVWRLGRVRGWHDDDSIHDDDDDNDDDKDGNADDDNDADEFNDDGDDNDHDDDSNDDKCDEKTITQQILLTVLHGVTVSVTAWPDPLSAMASESLRTIHYEICETSQI